MAFAFGARSLSFLANVDPAMVKVAQYALSFSSQDFGFTQPQFRTPAEEAALVAQGVSHTMHSHHMAQPPGGLGGAVDAVAWDGAKFVWEWPRQYVIAGAFKRASMILATPITWGGVWDRLMTEYSGISPADMEAAEQAYLARAQAANPGHRVLVDAPHFELGRN